MEQDYTKAPRLFLNTPLSIRADTQLDKDQSHYLLNVMRKNDNDMVRVFNGCDGEFIGAIQKQSKKFCTLTNLEQIKPQPETRNEIHLYFAPIKKDRMGFMIEKAVELGVTHIHPIITDRTQHGKINHDKIEKQIIEAAEQCERMDIPHLSPTQKLINTIFPKQTYVGLERDNAPLFHAKNIEGTSILIGPEGGWSNDERRHMNAASEFTPVSLGNNILRAETAALFMLSRIDKPT
jgi:16S rRNA (uracil1498-N3)-methyltransferase